MEKDLWFVRDAKTQNMTRSYKVKLLVWRCVDTLLFKTSLKPLTCWRVFLLKCFGAKIGRGCYISPKSTIYIPWNIEIGNFVSIDDYAYIMPHTKIYIGDYVSISSFVHIIPAGHDVRSRNFALDVTSTHIGNGVFIGADSYIGKGVTIGQMAVIGTRSVVLKDVPENTIAFGAPCQVRGERIPEEEYKKYRYNYIPPEKRQKKC